MRRLPPYMFARIDEAKARAVAKGLDVISMGVGDPDRDPPVWIRQLLCEEVMRSGNHRYPSYRGHPRLAEAVLRFLERRFGVTSLGPQHVATTIGSKEALAKSVTALVNPGDVVLMPDPNYPVFGTLSGLIGAEVRFLPLTPANGFEPDPVQELGEKALRRVGVMYVNYPHNPTGKLASRRYLARLVQDAAQYDFSLVADAAYTELYLDNEPAASCLEFDGALEHVIELHSFSKSFNMTGWRCGFAVGNAELLAGLVEVKSHTDSGCYDAIQIAMARALDDSRCDGFLAEQRALYRARAKLVTTSLEGLGLSCHHPGGSIFVWCELPMGERDSFDWCERLLSETGLVVSPGAGFGSTGEGFFRLSLTTPDETIEDAMQRLEEFMQG